MELGSEFSISLSDLSIQDNNVYRFLTNLPNTFFFDSGRSAIRYVASYLKSDDRVLLPEFICESVINCFDKENIIFYKVDERFQIDLADLKGKLARNVRVLFFAHYFGAVQAKETTEEIRSIAEKTNITIIEDITQSLFSVKKFVGDYIVCSVRKWVPLPGGGTLSMINNNLNISIPNLPKSTDNYRAAGMILKDLYLQHQFDCNKKYREIFVRTEELLDQRVDNKMMSDFSLFLLRCYDVREIILKRKANYQYLKKQLKPFSLLPTVYLKDEDCPLALVLRVNERDRFRRFLIGNHIFCAVHWPYDGINSDARSMAVKNSNTLISLPIDQRYSFEHIDYMVKIISKYRGDLHIKHISR